MKELNNYDFNIHFSSEEFEELGCDVVEIREHFKLERFKKIHDMGIDGRALEKDQLTIVQCKRFRDFKMLFHELKTKELSKVENLNPSRYILVLSISPTVKQKQKIFELFSPYILSNQDIISANDLNSYFRTQEFCSLKKHYDQLILSKSIQFSNILESIKNPLILKKSKFLHENIKEILDYFVETKIFSKSYGYLIEKHIIFLSGDAGSGKTTNAKVMMKRLVEDNLIDCYYLVNSCDELFTVLDSNQRQGILFDDFWGSTFEHLKSDLNDDKKLLDILEHIENLNNVYLILTTREYVLHQGLSYYKSFWNRHLEDRIIYKNCNYTDIEKVKILFSHAIHSYLDASYLNLIKYFAKDIIRKINYSPRLVQYFIKTHEDTNLDPYDFISDFLKFLDHPNQYLESIFYKLSEGAQVLSYILCISNPEMQICQFKKSFQAISKTIQNIKPSLFEDYLKELLDFFMDINSYHCVDFINHSIHDFIEKEFYKKIIDYEEDFCKGVIYFNQFYYLLTLKDTPLSSVNIEILIDRLIENFNELIITQDLDYFLSAEDSDSIDPKMYKNHKIWESLKIVELFSHEKLRLFLQKEIKNLFVYYTKHFYHYEDHNFLEIPEIINFGKKLGMHFNAEYWVKNYIWHCTYFFELYAVKYFPKSYQKIIQHEMEAFGKRIGKKLEQWILSDLGYLSKDGISYEYELTIEEMPNIFKMLKVPITPVLQNIFQELKNFHNSSYPIHKEDFISPKKQKLEEEIEKIHFEMQPFSIINYTKLKKEILASSLKNESKKRLIQSMKKSDNIWEMIHSSSISYIHFIIQFYKEEELQEKDITITKDIYPKLLLYMNQLLSSNHISFLKKYAFDSILNDMEYYSKKHIINKYQISNSCLNDCVEYGILVFNHNIVAFSDYLFMIYLAIMYIQDNQNIKYLKNFLADGESCKFEMVELFLGSFFYHSLLKPTFDTILLKGKEIWIQEAINISLNLKKGRQSTTFSSEIYLLLDYLSFKTDLHFIYEISQLFENQFSHQYVEDIDVKEYYLNKKNHDQKLWLCLNQVLDLYYEKLKLLFENISNIH